MELRFTKRTALLIFCDIVATFLAYYIASLLTGLTDEVFANTEIFFPLGIATIINLCMFALFRLYNDLWEYASVDDAIRITFTVGLSTLITAVFLWIIGVRLPIRVFFTALFVMVILVGGVRMLFRIFRNKGRVLKRLNSKEDLPRTLVVGAGETGSLAISRMANNDPLMPGRVIVAVDDNPEKANLRIHGIRVAGTSDDILELVERYDIEQIVVAIPSATLEQRKRIYGICTQTNCALRTLPNVRELRVDEINDVQLREVNVADLLGREEVVLNTRMVSGYIAGKTILVTGGGGSIGSELVRQLCLAAPKKIVVFDIYENTAYELLKEIEHSYDDVEVVVEIGSVRDPGRLERIFEQHEPTVVFHAAAHKHVPLMEHNPQEAIRNNVFGTMNLARAASEHGVDRFIFISTDKAVNPTSVMGATKKLGEMIVQSYEGRSKTVFSAVRFGNVMGSHGSVIPLFQKQIAAGGPVTVTDPEMTRYFMTIPEAARRVIQAGGLGKGGEIYVLDMGEPVKIVDLARKLIQLSGLRPDVDIKIEYVGLRPGEKLHEELWTDSEKTQATSYKDIMISTDEPVGADEVDRILEALEAVLDSDPDTIKRTLAEQLPSYTPMEHGF